MFQSLVFSGVTKCYGSTTAQVKVQPVPTHRRSLRGETSASRGTETWLVQRLASRSGSRRTGWYRAVCACAVASSAGQLIVSWQHSNGLCPTTRTARRCCIVTRAAPTPLVAGRVERCAPCEGCSLRGLSSIQFSCAGSAISARLTAALVKPGRLAASSSDDNAIGSLGRRGVSASDSAMGVAGGARVPGCNSLGLCAARSRCDLTADANDAVCTVDAPLALPC